MRSSACKYVLDKVSKFEKKYAKPIQNISKREEEEDDDFLSSKDDNSSSEHAVNKIKIIKNNTAFRSHVSEGTFHRKRLDGLSPMECDTIGASDIKTLSKSSQDTCETNEKSKVNVNQMSSRTDSTIESDRYEYDKGIKKIDTNFLSDYNKCLLTDDFNYKHSFEDINGLIAYKVDEDSRLYSEDPLKDTLISTEKKIESIRPETLLKIDIPEGGAKKGHLHVSLNLKLDEDPDEISDISSKGIASLSLENSISSQNVPIRVFTFEDLIGAEELKSVSEELKGNVDEKSQLNIQTPRTVDNSSRNSLLISDNLYLNSKSDDGDIHETSRNSSAEEIIANIDESSIEEDIAEVIERSVSENCNESSEQKHSSSENVLLSPETETKAHKNEVMSENSENGSENISKLDQFKDNHCSDESIRNFVGNDNRSDISLQKRKSDVIHHEVENSEKQLIKYNPKEISEVKNHIERDLKSTSEKHYRQREKDAKHFKYTKKNHNREKYLDNEWKLLQRSKSVLRDELHNASTQTDGFWADTYDFEKRMETIMKTSFHSMTEVNNLSLEVNNVLSEQTSHSASVSSPLERGFNCALKQQIELTKHFVCAEYNMYAVCMAAIKEMSSSYKPATLHYSKKMKRNLSSKKSPR